MRRVLPLLALLAAPLLTQAQASGAKAPPPAPPPYQLRMPAPEGERLATGRDGAALYSNRCGACHLLGGMAANLLTAQRIVVGERPDSALLPNRNDLGAAYIGTVVRQGKGAMPALTRVEVTDAELEAIARYLGQGKP